MKTKIFALSALLTTTIFATNTFAHPGHVEVVAGHSHSLGELALYGVALGVVVLLITIAIRAKSND